MDTDRKNFLPERKPPDSMTWARRPREYCERVRELAPKMGLDARKLVLGEVLYRITGDDRGIFQGYDWKSFNYSEAREKLMERLDWEAPVLVTVLENDPQMTGNLNQLKEEIDNFDWSDSKIRIQIYNDWSNFSEQIGEIVNKRPDLAAAKLYADDNRSAVKMKIKSLVSSSK